MSTRANVIIKDGYNQLFFYRHSDGYPEGTMPTLNEFLELVKSGKIRKNVSQASGHLILIGHKEYFGDTGLLSHDAFNWKVGAYEPTTGIHGDINYLYIVDLEKEEIKIVEDNFDKYSK